MKWYIVVEGRQTERKLYQSWLAHAFHGLERVARIEDMAENRYYLIVGHGYPSYLDRIRAAIDDIRDHGAAFDHLLVCVDAEEMSAEQRRAEIEDIIHEHSCTVDHTVAVHDCCIETWLLGNATLVRRNPQREALRRYQAFYDVRELDPESMPSMDRTKPRATFHHDYLCEMFRERTIHYSKSRPGHACEPTYLQELVKRVDTTAHLRSLAFLIERWRGLGAQL
jgi:hypothetical protein